MICKDCGIQLPDIAKFCYKCGKTVSAEDLQNDFDPFGTDDGFIPEKDLVKKESSQKETQAGDEDEQIVEQQEEKASVDEQQTVTAAEEELTADVKEETSKETVEGEESEAVEEEDNSEDEAPATTGFKIMRNPDYVPPEVEEEKPFYEEHVNYEEIREQRAAKMEKRMQVVSVIIGIAVIIGIGFFAFTKYTNHKDYTEKYDAAQALYDSGDYEGAFLAFGELVEHKGADEEEMVCKQFDCLQAIGDEVRARDFAYSACRKYSSDNIRKLLSAVGTSNTATKTPATVAPTVEPTVAPTVEPTVAPTVEPTVAPTQEPTQTPTQEPTVAPTQIPTQTPEGETENPTDTPDDEPETPVVDYTAYEDTFTQLYAGMEKLRNSADPMESLKVMITEEYGMVKASGKNIYFVNGEFSTEAITADNAMLLCNNGYVYFGNMVEGKLSGAGVCMNANKDDKGITYSYYRGIWENGCPHGAGNIEVYNPETAVKTVTIAKFVEGAYDGDVSVTNYHGTTELDKTTYSIVAGVPTPVQDEEGNDLMVDGKVVIGYNVLATGEQTAVTWDGVTKFTANNLAY